LVIARLILLAIAAKVEPFQLTTTTANVYATSLVDAKRWPAATVHEPAVKHLVSKPCRQRDDPAESRE
jgi:hypothetical protein